MYDSVKIKFKYFQTECFVSGSNFRLSLEWPVASCSPHISLFSTSDYG